MKRFKFSGLLLVGVLVLFALSRLLFPGGVLAQSPIETPAPPSDGGVVNPDDLMDVQGFLSFLAGPMGWLAVGAILSSLWDKWAWYGQQSVAVKRVVPLVAGVLISSVAQVLLTVVPADVWLAITPYWSIVAGVIMTFLGGELRYLLTRAKDGAQAAERVATAYLQAPHEE